MSCSLLNESILLIHKFGFFFCSISVYIHRHWQFEGCYWRDRTNLTNISTFDSSYASDISNSYFNTSKRDYQVVFQWKNPHLGKKNKTECYCYITCCYLSCYRFPNGQTVDFNSHQLLSIFYKHSNKPNKSIQNNNDFTRRRNIEGVYMRFHYGRNEIFSTRCLVDLL